MSVKERITRYKNYGYKVYHFIGDWYFVRAYSTNYKKFSWYELIKIKEA